LSQVEQGLRSLKQNKSRSGRRSATRVDANSKSLRYTLAAVNPADTSNALSSEVHTALNTGGSGIRAVRVFRVKCETDEARFEAFDELPNQKRLWYGVRKCELGGLLTHGVPFPAAEAPFTSYPFGKCIRLSGSAASAADRCLRFRAAQQDGDGEDDNAHTVFLGLCSVACGNIFSATHQAYYDRPPMPYHSVKTGSGDDNADVLIYDAAQLRLDAIVEVSMGANPVPKKTPAAVVEEEEQQLQQQEQQQQQQQQQQQAEGEEAAVAAPAVAEVAAAAVAAPDGGALDGVDLDKMVMVDYDDAKVALPEEDNRPQSKDQDQDGEVKQVQQVDGEVSKVMSSAAAPVALQGEIASP
jgi:hypothetical protein